MKWSPEQTEELKSLCFRGVSNADIAVRLGVPITEVYGKRSRMGLTIDKVNAILAELDEKPEPKSKPGPEPDLEPTQARFALPVSVRKAFSDLQQQVLLALAGDDTSLEQAKLYSLLYTQLKDLQSQYTEILNA